jgi:hypothetical protein
VDSPIPLSEAEQLLINSYIETLEGSEEGRRRFDAVCELLEGAVKTVKAACRLRVDEGTGVQVKAGVPNNVKRACSYCGSEVVVGLDEKFPYRCAACMTEPVLVHPRQDQNDEPAPGTDFSSGGADKAGERDDR